MSRREPARRATLQSSSRIPVEGTAAHEMSPDLARRMTAHGGTAIVPPAAKVTTRLGGGLGNQLFQYAFGRRMSLVNGAELFIDASGYEGVVEPDPGLGVRSLGLDHFRIQGTLIRHTESRMTSGSWLKRKVLKYWRRLLALSDRGRPYYLRRRVVEPEENHFRFDRRLYDRVIKGSVWFYGYWQTEKYFSDIAPLLREELVVMDPMDSHNVELGRLIETTNSVSIHVRHGDNASAVAVALGVLPLEYFHEAVEAIGRQVGSPYFFVFSDDMPWARAFVIPDFPTRYVEHNKDARDYEDLRLMSLCKHHIVGNSTFSWWGAWLGQKEGQIVYAPRRYYQNIDRPNPDLYPETWRLI